MSISENSYNKEIISKAEIEELDNYLTNLLHNLDEKVAVLESLSPPRSNNKSSQDIASDHDCSNIIQYSVEQDVCDPDITNVIAYEETETTEEGTVIVSNVCKKSVDIKALSDNISPVNSSVSLFSPVEPDRLSIQSCSTNITVNKSIDTISSIDTIERPPLDYITQINDSFDRAFTKLDDTPFHLFSAAQLDSSISGYMNLGSRSAAYYGEHPYMYSDISHPARPYNDNKYLVHIVSYIQIVLPKFKFNSAMVHKYISGSSVMPHHSDNEECIESDSDIVTISLGETRAMEFRNRQTGSVKHVDMLHGEVLIMSKSSQDHFTHAIPATMCKNMRLSITLRLIKPSVSPHFPEEPDPTIFYDDSDVINCSQSTVTNFLHDLSAMPSGNGPLDQIQERLNTPSFKSNDGYQDEPYQFLPTSQTHHYAHPQGSLPQRSLPQRLIPQRPQEQSQYPPYDRQRSKYSWKREGWQPPQRTTLTKPWQQTQFPPQQMHPSRNNANLRNSEFRPFQENSPDEVVFISSSMFAELDALKLSTDQMKSHVFFYRGADSKRMLEKLRNDMGLQNLVKKKTVSKVFLLTGTNNVDAVCTERQSMHDACSSISDTIGYVQSLFRSAVVNVINILPRISHDRRTVITKLNEHIKSVCERNFNDGLKFIDTYSIRMFTFPNGSRKSELFKYMFRNDTDNVHLNNYGIIKLGKHLKYLAHLSSF